MTLLQLHHQNKKTGECEFVSQNDIANSQDCAAWEKEAALKYPLPSDCQWLICNENSRHFLLTHTVIEKSERGEDLHEVSTVKELMKELNS